MNMSTSIESDVAAFLVPGSDFSKKIMDVKQVNRSNVTAVTAELFAVAVSNHEASTLESRSIADHYADATAMFYRSALESPGSEAAIAFYSVMGANGCCPKCTNIYLLLSGMAVIEDIGDEVGTVGDFVVDDGLCKRAVMFVARNVALKLVALKVKAIELKCFDFCHFPSKDIERMRESIHGH